MDSQDKKIPQVRMQLLRPFSGQSLGIFQNTSSQWQQEQGERRREPIVSYADLGRDTETGEIVRIGDVERRSGVYILGKPGMGKTTLMVNMILQDIEHGHGLCFLDPAGDAIEEVLKRLPDRRKGDVILLDPLDKKYTFGLNLFQCDDPTDPIQVGETLNTVLEVFAKLFTQTGNFEDAPAMFDTLFSTIILLIYNPSYTLTDVPLLLMNREASAKLIPNIGETHEDVRQWWLAYNAEKRFEERNKLTGSTRRRLQPFLTNELVRHIVGQKTTIDMRSIMDEGKILLVKLPRTQPQVTTLVGNLLIDRLLHAAYAREAIPEEKRRHFCLYCDEFQNYATSDFARLITEARKYHIATTIAHQERYGQLEVDRRVLGATLATAHKVIFQPTINDAEAVAWEFAERPKPARLEVLSDEERVVVEKERVDRIEDEIEDGWEPVRAPKGDIVAHLLKQPHPDPRVGAFVEKYVEKDPDNPWFNKLLYAGMARPEMIFFPLPQETLQSILPDNQFIRLLFEQDTDGSLSQALDTLRSVLEGLDAFLADAAREQPNMSAIDYQQKTLEYFSQFDLKDIGKSVLTQALGEARTEYNDVRALAGSSSDEWGRFRPDHSQDLVPPDYTFVRETDTGRKVYTGEGISPLYYPRGGSGRRRPLRPNRRFSSNLPDWTDRELSIMRAEEAEKQLPTPEEYTAALQKGDEEALAKFGAGLEEYLEFLSYLRPAMLALSQDPVETPETGHFQPRKSKKLTYIMHPEKAYTKSARTLAHPQRPVSDMVNEMAQELMSLPRFTAYAKIVEEVGGQQIVSKYKLNPDPLPQAGDETVVKMRKHKVRANTIRSDYYTERETVKQAIKARQAILLQREPRKPQTTLDENEE